MHVRLLGLYEPDFWNLNIGLQCVFILLFGRKTVMHRMCGHCCGTLAPAPAPAPAPAAAAADDADDDDAAGQKTAPGTNSSPKPLKRVTRSRK